MGLKTSIALCTYNGQAYLRQQLESFLEQTVRPDELIICDDGSTDETIPMIRSFMETAPFPVRLYQNEKNLGSSKNFEKAILLSSGDIVFLSDQDDRWVCDKIMKTLKAFDENPEAGMVFCDAFIIDGAGVRQRHTLWDASRCGKKIRKEITTGDAFSVFLRKNFATGVAMAFRRELIPMITPIPASWIHDHYIAMVSAAVGQVVPLDEALVDYRQHASQQIGGARDLFLQKVHHRLTSKKNRHRTYMQKMPDAVENMRNKLSPEQMDKVARFSAHMEYREGIIQKPFFQRLSGVIRHGGAYMRYVDGLYDAVSDILRV